MPLHELGHGYDWAMGDISASPTFEAVWKADFAALTNTSYYYVEPDKYGDFDRARSETYAESFANYYAGKAKWFSDKPALYKYFQNLPRQVQPPGKK